MVLSLDTDVTTPPDPTPGVTAATAVSLPSSLSKPPARLSLPSGQSEGMIYM